MTAQLVGLSNLILLGLALYLLWRLWPIVLALLALIPLSLFWAVAVGLVVCFGYGLSWALAHAFAPIELWAFGAGPPIPPCPLCWHPS